MNRLGNSSLFFFCCDSLQRATFAAAVMYKFTRRQGAIHGDAQRAASVGLIEPPAWLPYMDLHPPPAPALSLGRGKHKIEYKEEVIAKTWLRLHPELQAVPLRKFMGDSRWYKPVVSYWAEKQLRFMDQGYSKKQAFKLAHEEFLANRAQRALEVELVRLQALQMGIPAKPDVNPLFQMNRDLAKKLMFELEQSEQNKEVYVTTIVHVCALVGCLFLQFE